MNRSIDELLATIRFAIQNGSVHSLLIGDNELARLIVEIEELRAASPSAPTTLPDMREVVEALEPFSEYANFLGEPYKGCPDDHKMASLFGAGEERHIVWGDFRRARTALANLRARIDATPTTSVPEELRQLSEKAIAAEEHWRENRGKNSLSGRGTEEQIWRKHCAAETAFKNASARFVRSLLASPLVEKRTIETDDEWLRKSIEASLSATPSATTRSIPEELRERLAQFLHDEIEWPEHHGAGDWSWPVHDGDDGYRGKSGWLKITPPDLVERFREMAERILIHVRFASPSPSESGEWSCSTFDPPMYRDMNPQTGEWKGPWTRVPEEK